jgi:CRISPR-associated endonuclease Csn1
MLQSVKKKKVKTISVPKSRKPLCEFPIKKNIYLGLDVGTASCGWAIVHVDDAEHYPLEEEALKIEAGVWMFKEPVTDKERSPKNENRRAKRLERRTIRRRKIRKQKIRQILFKVGLIDSLKPNGKIQDDAIGKYNAKPWLLRQQALNTKLEKHELASVILHIAKRRGFKSNAKNDGANEETSKMKIAMSEFQKKLIDKTYSQAVHENAVTIQIGKKRKGEDKGTHIEQKRYRNVDRDYQFTPYRDDILAELGKIFEAQTPYYPDILTPDFQDEIHKVITKVNPMQDPIKMLGYCTFYDNEKRCSMSSPSYELFRFLSKLVSLRLMDKSTGEIIFFMPEHIAICEKLFWTKKKISFTDIENALSEYKFYPAPNPDQMKNDITSPKGEAGTATHILKKHLKDLGLFDDDDYTKNNLKALDNIANIISFYNNKVDIEKQLKKIKCLSPDDVADIMTVMENKDFNSFNKAGHLSSKAMRQLIPYLRNGLKYNDAVKQIGFDFRDRTAKLDPIIDIANPSAKKAVHEAFKQVRALIHAKGYRPEKIFIEMTRDIAQTKKVKKEIEDSIKVNEKFNKDTMDSFEEKFKFRPEYSSEQFLAYKLWKRQGGLCLYSGECITPEFIIGNETQIDHVLPYSRFLDNSQNNKALVFTAQNQAKGNQTPYEWFMREDKDWQAFKDRINNMNLHKRIKWALCLEPKEDGKYPQEDQMSKGALNATGYAVKYLKNYLIQEVYEGKGHHKGETVSVFPRSGKITSLLRKSWGVEDLKKDENGIRTTDQRHHALDAIVVATADDKALKKLVYYAQKHREIGKSIKNSVPLEPPCHNFRNKIKDLYENHIVVSRGEDMRARGKLHNDTLCSIRNTGEKDKKGNDILKTIKRKEVSKLKISDLDTLPEEAKKNHQLINALINHINTPATAVFTFNDKKIATVWLLIDSKKERKSVFDLELDDIDLIDKIDENPELKQALSEYVVIPKKPALIFKGVPIKKISLYDKPANEDDFLVRGAKPNSLSNYRVDIFTKANDKGKKLFYMVCVLTHEALNKTDYPQPPNIAIDGTKIDNTFDFKFSIYPNSYVRVTKGDITEGFFRGCDIDGNRIKISSRNDSKVTYRFGIKMLDNIQKFTMNRLGRLREVTSEKRSWGLPKQ